MSRVPVSPTGSRTNAHDIEPASSPRTRARCGSTARTTKRSSAVGRHREDVADLDLLELREDPVRARDSGVVETVVAVPAGAPAPHLHQPRPDGSRSSADRDGVRPADLGVRHQLVTWQRSGGLAGNRANRTPRYRSRCDG